MTEYKVPFRVGSKVVEKFPFWLTDTDGRLIAAACNKEAADLIVTALNKLMDGEAPPKRG